MLLGGIVICNQAGGLACGRVRHVPGELATAHQLELTSFASPTLLWPPSTPPPRSRRAARATRRSLRRARVVVVQVEGAFAARPLDITVVRLTVVVDLLHLRVQQDLASARACVTVAMDGRRLRRGGSGASVGRTVSYSSTALHFENMWMQISRTMVTRPGGATYYRTCTGLQVPYRVHHAPHPHVDHEAHAG
jgi:hypothetical protein